MSKFRLIKTVLNIWKVQQKLKNAQGYDMVGSKRLILKKIGKDFGVEINLKREFTG